MSRPYFILCSLLWSVILIPGIIRAQDPDADIKAAIAMYRADDPVKAAQQLRAILTSSNAERLTPALLSRAYTYLAMSEWAMYLRPEAEAAMESALRADVKTFVEHGEQWAKESQVITDAVVSTILANAVMLYEEAEYSSSIDELTRMLPLENVMGPRLATGIHKYLAFCYVAMGKNSLAQQELRQALRFDPQLELGDDAVIAPKLRRVFLAVHRDAIRKSQHNARRNTILRSLLIPGWGQIYRGSSLRGYGYMAAEVTLLTGMILSVRSYIQARDAYEQFSVDDAVAIYNQREVVADVKRELDARYHRFQSNSSRANTMIALAFSVWTVNVVDAFILSLRRDRMNVAGRGGDHLSGLTMAWDPVRQQWGVRYQVSW